MTTVVGTVTAPGGGQPEALTIDVVLISEANGRRGAGLTEEGVVVAGESRVTMGPGVGQWSITLIPNSLIVSPTGTYYQLIIMADGHLSTRSFVVPDSLFPQDIEDLLVLSPVPPAFVSIQGPQGIQGVAGPPGASGEIPAAYVHEQAVPEAVWVVEHGMGFYPNVAVVDSALSQVEGEVVYINTLTLTITFTAAFAGRAFLS